MNKTFRVILANYPDKYMSFYGVRTKILAYKEEIHILYADSEDDAVLKAIDKSKFKDPHIIIANTNV